VRALTIWNGNLIAGGDFTQAGGVLGAQYVARWSGSGWSAMGTPSSAVNALALCGGTLAAAPGSDVVYWDGSTWTVVGGRMNSPVNALAEFDNFLFAAGDFSVAGTVSSQHIARLGAQQTGIFDPVPLAVTMRAFPNPFRSRTNLVFELETAGVVEVSVFDLQGRRLATLYSGVRPAGQHEIEWNGRDDHDRPVASGMYYLLLRTSERSRIQKVVRIR